MDHAVTVHEHRADRTDGGHRASRVARCARPVGFLSPMSVGAILMSASPGVALDAELLRCLDLRLGSVR